MAAISQQMQAIIAEAQSSDPWTSRARPSFLYVMYTLILWAIPMGLISAANPGIAKGIAEGMTAYLRGIPEALCFVRHRLCRLHGGADLGEGEGRGAVAHCAAGTKQAVLASTS